MDDCLFCKIYGGEIPSEILYKDDQDPFPQGYRLNDTWPKNV